MELIRGHKNHIEVVLLEVILLGLSSREILREAGRMSPQLKVILMSAYSKEAVAASFSGLSVERFIRKPFQLTELVSVLQDALSDYAKRTRRPEAKSGENVPAGSGVRTNFLNHAYSQMHQGVGKARMACF